MMGVLAWSPLPWRAGVPIGLQPTFIDPLKQWQTAVTPSRNASAGAGGPSQQASAGGAPTLAPSWLRSLRAALFTRLPMLQRSWRAINALVRWLLFPTLVAFAMFAIYVASPPPPPPPPPLTPSPPPLLPRPTLPPTPPFAPPSPVIDIAEPDERPLFQLAIDMADGLSALCGAIATLMSGNILFRRDCERVPRALRKLLRYAAIIFATGFVVGGVLSWIYANEWDSRELVVLACDAVLGWHLMRALVIEAPDLFIVRGVRFGGTRVGFGRRFRGGLGLI